MFRCHSERHSGATGPAGGLHSAKCMKTRTPEQLQMEREGAETTRRYHEAVKANAARRAEANETRAAASKGVWDATMRYHKASKARVEANEARAAATKEVWDATRRYHAAAKANARARREAAAERERVREERRSQEAQEAAEALERALVDHARLLGQFYKGKGPKLK